MGDRLDAWDDGKDTLLSKKKKARLKAKYLLTTDEGSPMPMLLYFF